MSTKEKIVVLAKAIPAKSLMHGEITCVAGIAEDDKWRRLYPMPTSLLGKSYFMKFSVIEVEVEAWQGAHTRPEDRYLVSYGRCVQKIEDWEERRAYLRKHLDKSISAILSSGRSLGLIKPEIEEFYQDSNGKLRYKFRDSERSYDLVCREWEALALARKHPNQFDKVRAKFRDWMEERDTYFVIGTTADNVTKMVVAVHYPPKA
jgi:hypothetical protein